MELISKILHIKGLVQGVGFRPYIFRLAKKYHIKGWVTNSTQKVEIKAEGEEENIKSFINSIKNNSPEAADIDSIEIFDNATENFKNFNIIKSIDNSDEITEISPDIAVCNDCLKDLKIQPHRKNYPLINCTNCGPRFTIITNLPYDRHQTTMHEFKMCKICKAEYENISNRRFHAQPIACNHCGPQYELLVKNNKITHIEDILTETARLIEAGKIIALKGQGGFHLACNALDEKAVSLLRKSKLREGKPFAVMFKNLEKIKNYAFVSPDEEKSLTSWRKPIVVLKSKIYRKKGNIKKRAGEFLAPGVSNGFCTIGAMLPYMPFHYLLFEKLNSPVIVLTSGNISDEPIIIKNPLATEKFIPFSTAFVTYNREIYNRTDDSVCMVINGSERLIRRSRGYVPKPIKTNINVEGIFASGAELNNCFAIGRGNQAILSQHIGDLKNYETYEFYTETIEQFKKMFRINPSFVACDMHPDYLSTRYANDLSLPVIQVQHHHAHIVAAMAEHSLDEKVIGVSMDGTGFGTDGNIWGGEFFICDLAVFERFAHFSYIPLPGGDTAVKEPWRVALSFLYQIYKNELFNLDIPFIRSLNKQKAEVIISALKNNINAPLSSSAGRVFDAVSAVVNLCPKTQFHAEAPMRLENIIEHNVKETYSYEFGTNISFYSVFFEIIEDLKKNTPVPVISAKFHNTIISIIFAMVKKMQNETGINKVVLSGGTFQNKYLSERIENKLINEKLEVFVPQKIPANDGGIALGQLMIAAKRREIKCV